MIVKIKIKDTVTNEEAILQYDNDTAQQSVVWGVPGAKEVLGDKLLQHLTTEREYKIPVSEDTDEFETVKALPVSSVMFFELSLSSLFLEKNIKLGTEVS